jgi:hypothetical protein
MWQKNFCGKICRTNRKMVQTGGCCVAEKFFREKQAGRKGVTTVWAKNGAPQTASVPRVVLYTYFFAVNVLLINRQIYSVPIFALFIKWLSTVRAGCSFHIRQPARRRLPAGILLPVCLRASDLFSDIRFWFPE